CRPNPHRKNDHFREKSCCFSVPSVVIYPLRLDRLPLQLPSCLRDTRTKSFGGWSGVGSALRTPFREGTMAHATPLYISQILGWADAFQERTGRWPNLYSGKIWTQRTDNWRRVDSALRLGLRGLPGGSSLARLLAEQRG